MIRRGWRLACVVATAACIAAAHAQDQLESYNPDFFASASPATAMDMINRLPGFTFDGGDSSRGFSGNAGNVLINGRRPSSKTDSLSAVLSRIVAGDVERIEVIRGGAPGIDMQGKPVVANVIRRQVDSTNIVVTSSMNYFTATGRFIPAGQVEYSRTLGDRSYTLAIRRDANFNDDIGLGHITRTDGLGNAVFTEQMRRASGGTVGLNGAVQTPLAGGDLGVNATATQYEFSNGTTYFFAGGPEDFASTQRNRNGEVGANYSLDWNGPVLDLVGLQRIGDQKSTQILDQSGSEVLYSSLRQTSESIARATLRVPLAASLSAEGGAEAAYNTLSGQTQLSQGGAVVVVPASDVEVSETRGEAFGQMSWQMRDDLSLEMGVRAEYSTISQGGGAVAPRSFFYPKPRALLSWAPDQDSQLRVRAERLVGQLNFNEFVSSANLTQGNVTAGNPELEPDHRWQYEVTYERRFWNRGAVVLTLLHEEVSNMLANKPVFTPTGVFDVRGNVGDGTVSRVSLDATIPTDTLGIPGGLFNMEGDWRDSNQTDPVTGQPRRIPAEDPTSYEVSFTQDLERLNSTWSVSYSDGSHYLTYRYRQLDNNFDPAWLNVKWIYQPSSNLNLTFAVNNLLSATRRRDSTYFTTSRTDGAVARRENEVSYNRPRFFVSVRKTFN